MTWNSSSSSVMVRVESVAFRLVTHVSVVVVVPTVAGFVPSVMVLV